MVSQLQPLSPEDMSPPEVEFSPYVLEDDSQYPMNVVIESQQSMHENEVQPVSSRFEYMSSPEADYLVEVDSQHSIDVIEIKQSIHENEIQQTIHDDNILPPIPEDNLQLLPNYGLTFTYSTSPTPSSNTKAFSKSSPQNTSI